MRVDHYQVGDARRHPGGRHRQQPDRPDRKSTRLNSSHTVISYAVFCLKKKKKLQKIETLHTLTPTHRADSTAHQTPIRRTAHEPDSLSTPDGTHDDALDSTSTEAATDA